MIIDKVILDNFAIYGGRHEINLAPTSPARPIVLFGGLNGSGKTTFLDAVQLALYGKQARCSNRGARPYDAFLREAIHRGADPTLGAAIEIHFRRTSEGKESRFALTRRWADTGKGVRERVEVVQDGVLNPVLGDGWAEYIDAYLPNRIADLFFFDGEQIKELAESANAAQMLQSAVNSLLGLDIVDRLSADLLVIERRKRLAAKNDAERQKLEGMQEECSKLEALHEAATHECAEASNTVDRIQKRVTDLDQAFRQEGGELFARKKEIEAERQGIQSAIESTEESLRELAAGPLPLVLVAAQLDALEQQAATEVSFKENQVLLALLAQRDAQLLRLLSEHRSPAKTVGAVQTFLQLDRRQRETTGHQDTILHADSQTLHTLRTLRVSILPKLREEAKAQVSRLGELQRQLDLVDQQLAQVPQAEALATRTEQIRQAREQLREAQARLDALEAKKALIERELTAKKSAYARELESHEHARIEIDNDTRILRHSAKVRDTLAKFRAAAVERRIAQLEGLILDSFSQLIRKEHFLTAIKIAPTDFSVTLIAADGQPLPITRLSTGERQLLATSMLWGLARASGRTVPTIIDTPLGRLDSSHRAHLVQRYFPVASHQVVLLSTDEEIDECYLERLKPYLTRSYRLAYDNRHRSTTPEEGYFWK